MDIKEKLYHYLTVQLRCKVEERNGIWYITDPDGTRWDMTVPMQDQEFRVYGLTAWEDHYAGGEDPP